MSDLEAKLQHLTADQIETLYNEYTKGERVAVLLERYGVDLTPASLIKALPPVPCTELSCPYCKKCMYQKRKSRTSPSWQDSMVFCKTCTHRHYHPGRSRWRRDCTCPPCAAERERSQQEQAMDHRRRVVQHWSLAKRAMVPFHELTITHKLHLMAMLEVRKDVQHNVLHAAEHATGDAWVSPSTAMDTQILQALHEDGILLVDPNSPLDAFSNDLAPKAWRDKVRWVGNVTLDGEHRAGLTPLYRVLHKELSAGARPQWRAQLIEAIRALLIEEVCVYIAARCAEHGLPFEARKKAEQVAAQLLETHPVRHVWSLANTAIRGALSFIARSHVTKLHAANTIPASMLAMGERALREHWQFSQATYGINAPRSALSRVLFDVLLKQEDHGLEHPLAGYINGLPLAGRNGPQ
ncbi:hypothetical protein [Pseudomonas sp. PSKL.D1]|uniref:hypothetical protein n=1 Tax=Pseudomonas sp. PSKL.D1 TaxID=3029060 RepID=UPI002380F744|nr:hypothetical protein [Pseudomonas sp. PSKL.D1]WDY56054.1 hypothetical protein PVV54_15745 [Pseudomonas sp. PSKL.D1]